MRVLALLTDAFGGRGGIALYNRDILTALCDDPKCKEVVAVPFIVPHAIEKIPSKLKYNTKGVDSRIKYFLTVLNEVRRDRRFDLILCSHISLLPVAVMLSTLLKITLVLEVYGYEAWKPTARTLVNLCVNRIDAFISISELTKRRFLIWSKLDDNKGFLLPNAIHMEKYGVGSKEEYLLEKYKLKGKTVLMTMGRILSEEKAKGFDQVIEILPDLEKEIPNVVYLIVGGGNDLERLSRKAKDLGVGDRVIFTGWISEEEKANHFRLADAFVMPSRWEGFGFVFLEAMACGIPVVASKIDGSYESVLGGKLGIVVDPDNEYELKAGIHAALKRVKAVPDGLTFFEYKHFRKKLHRILNCLIKPQSPWNTI